MKTYLEVCAGISATTIAVHGTGWEPFAFAEVEPFPCAVLAHHYPATPNLGDLTKHDEWNITPGTIDALLGGTPCQAFSIAGERGGIHDHRGNLALEFLRLAARAQPRWVVWENVPGVLTSISHEAPDPREPSHDLDADDGPEDGQEILVEDEYESDEMHAFQCFISGLRDIGYGVAYRILDAQHFGVAQQRRRVFVIGYLGDWRCAAAALFERDSLRGDRAKSEEPRPRAAPETGCGTGRDHERVGTLAGTSPNGGWRIGASEAAAGHIIVSPDPSASVPGRKTARALNAGGQGRQDFDTETIVVSETAPAITCTPWADNDSSEGKLVIGAITSDDSGPDVKHAQAGHIVLAAPYAFQPRIARNGRGDMGDTVNALTAQAGADGRGDAAPCIAGRMGVRRLTVRECERLQGMPDDYTLIPGWGDRKRTPEDFAETVAYLRAAGFSDDDAWNLADTPDGPHYRAIGNSMAVPVMRWIFHRIDLVDSIIQAHNPTTP